ncbi:unnamed protein product [Paramecium primaurelia]|uniref:Uncharacterized protein n=1 Tax=Paramecium primaurelia TaxID=5886 RepID=A0A8S1KLP6_PARPR|nr:unnamed protein product [Paramecium primaurelia]CAD8056130.1 unnamed protein product [Paramecium primaurelia]
MQINQEFLFEELASQNNHQEIIDFCDSQISSIKFSQINSLTNQTHILDYSLELYKATEQSSGNQILSRVDSFVNKFQIEHAYEVYYKQTIKSLKILQRYQEIIEYCDQLQILCQEKNQEIYCQKEKSQQIRNKHNMNYYLQMGKEYLNIIKNDLNLIEEAVACLDYGMIQNDSFQEQFNQERGSKIINICLEKLLKNNEKINEAEAYQKQLDSLELS